MLKPLWNFYTFLEHELWVLVTYLGVYAENGCKHIGNQTMFKVNL